MLSLERQSTHKHASLQNGTAAASQTESVKTCTRPQFSAHATELLFIQMNGHAQQAYLYINICWRPHNVVPLKKQQQQQQLNNPFNEHDSLHAAPKAIPAPRSHASEAKTMLAMLLLLLFQLRSTFSMRHCIERDVAMLFACNNHSHETVPFRHVHYGRAHNTQANIDPGVCAHWTRTQNRARLCVLVLLASILHNHISSTVWRKPCAFTLHALPPVRDVWMTIVV